MQDQRIDTVDLDLQLAALLLHDLEIPLTVAKQFIKRVEDGRFDSSHPKHQQLLQSTKLALARGEQVLHDLLDQARFGADGVNLHPTQTDIREMSQNSVNQMRALAEESEVELVFEAEQAVSLTAEFDQGLIARVLDNLLVNAIRHARSGTTVFLRVKRSSTALHFEVVNTPAQPLDLEGVDIFNPVHQLQLRQQRRLRGSGLGLAFCRLIVAAHDGRIGALSAPNGDTVFWVEIPINPEKKQKGTHHG